MVSKMVRALFIFHNLKNRPQAENWIASLTIQNANLVGTYVTVQYYDGSGNLVQSYTFYLQARRSLEITNTNGQSNDKMPYDFIGSAKIFYSGANLVAVVHQAELVSGNHFGYGGP